MIPIPARVFALFVSESILLATCFVTAGFADPDIGDMSLFLSYESGIFRIAGVAGFIILGLFFSNLYSDLRVRSRLALFQSLCLVFGAAFVEQGLVGYLNPNWIVPRKMMLGATIVALPGLFGWRLLFDRVARQAISAVRVLFLGVSPTVARMISYFDQHPEMRFMTVGYLESGSPIVPSGVARLGTMEDLDEVMQRALPDSIVIGNREDIQPWWADEFLALRFGGVQVHEAGTLYERIFARKCVTEIWPSRAIFTGEFRPRSVNATLQPFYSWVLALAVVVLTLPLTLIISALIWLGSPGPVLTRETRIGFHEVPFEAYRFRCVEDEGRYTLIGRFLRRHGLVWMPQLLNVLKGQMVVVGPRPERPLFVDRMSQLMPVYRQRHQVKPGVTGWARIHRQRGEAQDSIRDLEYDLYYIEHVSPLMDFFILLLSLKSVAGDSVA